MTEKNLSIKNEQTQGHDLITLSAGQNGRVRLSIGVYPPKGRWRQRRPLDEWRWVDVQLSISELRDLANLFLEAAKEREHQ